MLDFMSGADVRLVRSPSLLATAIALQGAIVLLDAATVWILIRALGVTASVGGVFVSFREPLPHDGSRAWRARDIRGHVSVDAADGRDRCRRSLVCDLALSGT
jgi:hypothetical protein